MAVWKITCNLEKENMDYKRMQLTQASLVAFLEHETTSSNQLYQEHLPTKQHKFLLGLKCCLQIKACPMKTSINIGFGFWALFCCVFFQHPSNYSGEFYPSKQNTPFQEKKQNKTKPITNPKHIPSSSPQKTSNKTNEPTKQKTTQKPKPTSECKAIFIRCQTTSY